MASDGADWLAPAARLLEPAAALFQPAFEALLRAPKWTGWALFAFGVLLIALGRQGQRPLMGALVGAACWWAAVTLGLAGKPLAADLPSAEPLAAAGLGALLGALLPSWTRALALGGLGAAFGDWLARRLGAPPLAGALPLAVLLFLVAFVNEQTFAVLLPPLGAAPALVFGLVRSLPAEIRGRYLPLSDCRVLLVATGLLALALLPLAISREARARRRKQALAESGEDLTERAKRAAQKAVFESAAERAKESRAAKASDELH